MIHAGSRAQTKSVTMLRALHMYSGMRGLTHVPVCEKASQKYETGVHWNIVKSTKATVLQIAITTLPWMMYLCILLMVVRRSKNQLTDSLANKMVKA